jgi:hypothetical protein
MGGLADSKDLLLDFGHSLETNLDPEITPGDHHGNHLPAHCREQNSRQSFNRGTVLNFENDSSVPCPKAVELSDQFGDIFWAPNKGQRDQIPIFGRKLETLTVLRAG